MRKVVTVVGARPQFIKAATVSRALAACSSFSEVMIHTGQHFDDNMSEVFFSELQIPRPVYQLDISGGGHGAMTGRMLGAIEPILLKENPDWVLIYGDTNSTLAGAIAAAKLNIRVAHVEAGLRSFNMRMPEEVNRILADRISSLLLCPTDVAVENLRAEGQTKNVLNVGDVMYDAALFYSEVASDSSDVLRRLGIEKRSFALATCHRAENTDDPSRLAEIIKGLKAVAGDLPVILPLHPRTRKLIGARFATELAPIIVTEPLSYLDMVALEKAARLIITDSGGVQKEAFFFGVPCITTRDETEWTETVELGSNILVGASSDRIVAAARSALQRDVRLPSKRPYGNGDAAGKIVAALA